MKDLFLKIKKLRDKIHTKIYLRLKSYINYSKGTKSVIKHTNQNASFTIGKGKKFDCYIK